MTMMDYFVDYFGIFVAVGSFLFTYRHTVGARRARIAAANAELGRILVRRIVVDGNQPKELDIVRLTDGKARDHGVASGRLWSPQQLLNMAYTRIVESDLIPSDRRESLLDRLTPLLAELEVEAVEMAAEDNAAGATARSRSLDWTAATGITALATALGAVSTVSTVIPLPDVTVAAIRESPELALQIAATVVGSLVAITLILYAIRLRTSQGDQEIPRDLSGETLETYVRTTLQDLDGLQISSHSDVDFLVEYKNRRIAVEVKAWRRPVAQATLALTMKRLTARGKRPRCIRRAMHPV